MLRGYGLVMTCFKNKNNQLNTYVDYEDEVSNVEACKRKHLRIGGLL